MSAYLAKAQELLSCFDYYEVIQVRRTQTTNAESLAKLTSIVDDELSRMIPIEFLPYRSISHEEPTEVRPVSVNPSCMDPIVCFMRKGELLEDRKESQKIHYRTTCYTLIDEIFYKKGFSLPSLCCVRLEEADYVLQEIHFGRKHGIYLVDIATNCEIDLFQLP